MTTETKQAVLKALGDAMEECNNVQGEFADARTTVALICRERIAEIYDRYEVAE